MDGSHAKAALQPYDHLCVREYACAQEHPERRARRLGLVLETQQPQRAPLPTPETHGDEAHHPGKGHKCKHDKQRQRHCSVAAVARCTPPTLDPVGTARTGCRLCRVAQQSRADTRLARRCEFGGKFGLMVKHGAHCPHRNQDTSARTGAGRGIDEAQCMLLCGTFIWTYCHIQNTFLHQFSNAI